MSITWSPRLEVGVDTIDAQHRELFERFEAFDRAARAGDQAAEAARALAFLSRYVDEHFGEEEQVMSAAAYPGLALHRDMHRAFTGELAELAERHRAHGATPSFLLAFANLFESWLVLHITKVDQKLGLFLRAAGADPGPRGPADLP